MTDEKVNCFWRIFNKNSSILCRGRFSFEINCLWYIDKSLHFFSDNLKEMRNTLGFLKAIFRKSNSVVIENSYKNYSKVYRKCLKDTRKLISYERESNSYSKSHSNVSVNDFVSYFSTIARVIIDGLPVTKTFCEIFSKRGILFSFYPQILVKSLRLLFTWRVQTSLIYSI